MNDPTFGSHERRRRQLRTSALPERALYAGAGPSDGLEIRDALLADLEWSGSSAQRVTFRSCTLRQVNVSQSRLERIALISCDGSEVMLYGTVCDMALLQRVTLRSSRMSGVAITDATVEQVTFSQCKLDSVNFRFSRLKKVEFVECALTQADFYHCTFEDVRFTRCDLTASTFDQAACTKVDLRSSEISGLRGIAGLSGATIDVDQLLVIAPSCAQELGIVIAAAESAEPDPPSPHQRPSR